MADLWGAVARHRRHLRSTGQLGRGARTAWPRCSGGCLRGPHEAKIDELAAGEEFATAVKALAAGELDPYQAADHLLGP